MEKLTTTWIGRITDAVLLEAAFTKVWCQPGFQSIAKDFYGELAIEMRERFVAVGAHRRAVRILSGSKILSDM